MTEVEELKWAKIHWRVVDPVHIHEFEPLQGSLNLEVSWVSLEGCLSQALSFWKYGGNFPIIMLFTVSSIIKTSQQMIVKKLKYAAKK